jgi:hypothetical protein
MTCLLDTDPRLRKLWLIKKDEKVYTRSVLSRVVRKVGEDNLNKIIEETCLLQYIISEQGSAHTLSRRKRK